MASDIGCYTLAALPPLEAVESCVCMGASIGMAKGASDAGLRPAVAVIGDSTFLHSGVTPLMDAVAADTDMTVVILDNEVVAMTGAQPTLLPSSRLPPLLLGLGVDPDHCHVIDAHPRRTTQNAAVIRRELEHPGLSVIVAVRATDLCHDRVDSIGGNFISAIMFRTSRTSGCSLTISPSLHWSGTPGPLAPRPPVGTRGGPSTSVGSGRPSRRRS